MFRNKEIARLFWIFLITGAVGFVILSVIDFLCAVIYLGFIVILALTTLGFTIKRYRQISQLSVYLNRIASGEYGLDLRDNVEGELSALKNDIYKVTVMLAHQADLLQKDKLYLADTLADISHQLKTPLTSMMVMTDLLEQPDLPAEKRREFTGHIRSQLQRMEWLISSLLKLSKLDAGTIRFKKEQVFLPKLIEKATEHLMLLMDVKQQTLVLDGDPQTYFLGDPDWSAEAMTNLIKNCIEHTPSGGTIHIQYESSILATQIIISDTGEGVSKEDLPHIFERFYKGKNSSRDSVGIGLAMAKNIIQRQNGTLEATSEIGKGMTFTIKFYRSIV